jgi:hypothetical protein
MKPPFSYQKILTNFFFNTVLVNKCQEILTHIDQKNFDPVSNSKKLASFPENMHETQQICLVFLILYKTLVS